MELRIRCLRCALAACTAAAAVLGASPGMSQESDSVILAPGAALERVFSGGSFTEGPAMGPDGCVYFSDLTFRDTGPWEDGHIWRFDPGDGSCRIYRSPSCMSNGIEFDARRRMVSAHGGEFGGRGLVRTDVGTGRSEILAARYEDRPLNSPNDLVIDAKGRIYFTDPRYGDRTSVAQPVQGVYRLDPDGRLTLIIADISNPNGIALSPDERTLYVGCNDEGRLEPPCPSRMALLSYSLMPDGSVVFRDTLDAYGAGAGPDGFAIDRNGHLYVALRDESSPGVAVYAPGGGRIAYIRTPEVPSNVAFARPPADSVLYVTAGGSLYAIRTRQHGWFATLWEAVAR